MTKTSAAFGKLILLGEHAVVYRVAALVCGIDTTLRATAALSAGPSRLTLLAEERELPRDDDPLARAFAALLSAASGPVGSVTVRVEGELPPGMGLGFSAAAAVAVARAVEALRVLARDTRTRVPRDTRSEALADDEAVQARATAWERIFHGNPSGVDVAAAMHGGLLRFVRGEGVRRVFPKRPLSLCVGLSGSPASTKIMVDGVAALRERTPEAFDKTLQGIAVLVDNAQSAIEKGDVIAIGELMNLNQMLLAGWLLSTGALESLCAAAREAGALGAKLTGSGGGGAVVALAGSADDGSACERAARIVAAWRALGYEGFAVTVGEQGRRG